MAWILAQGRKSVSRRGMRANLSLLMNCIVAWNTHYIGKAIEQLRADEGIHSASEGNQIDSSLIAHITPLMHAHINPYGTYYFNIVKDEGGQS